MTSPRLSAPPALAPDFTPRCPSHANLAASGSCPGCSQLRCALCGDGCTRCEERAALAETVRRRARRALRFLIASGVFIAGVIAAEAAGLHLRWEEEIGEYETLVTLLDLLVYGATGFAFLRWLHGLMRLAPLLGAPPSRQGFGPRMAVVWWLVPVANFLVPFQLMRELHDRLAADDAAPRAQAQAFLRVWWFTWLASSLLSFLRGSLRLADLLSLVALWACIRVLRELQGHAERRLHATRPA